MKPRPWTPHEDLILRKLVAGGSTDQAIAIELERSVEEVRERARELGITIEIAGPATIA